MGFIEVWAGFWGFFFGFFFARTRLLLCFISHSSAGIKSAKLLPLPCFTLPKPLPCSQRVFFHAGEVESCSSGAGGILPFEDRRGSGGILMPGEGKRGKKTSQGERTTPSIPSPHRLFLAAEAPCSSPGFPPCPSPAAEPSPSDSGERIN